MDSRRQRAFRALLLSLAACGCVAAVYSAGTAQAVGRNRRAHTAEINAAALAGAAPLTPNQKALVARAARSEKDGWILLHIEGDARARGFQHGYLLAKEIAESLEVRRVTWKYQSGMEWRWLVEKTRERFTRKVDTENRAELEGLAEGLGAAGVTASVEELVAYNGFFELTGYWWPEVKAKFGSAAPNPPKQSCSSFIATGNMTANGEIVLAHNTMFPYPQADANVIVDIVPERGHRILMQIFPGWIHSGTDFFITSAGLVGSETTIGGFKGFDENGTLEFARMRRAAQDASSIEEWVKIMRTGNNGGYANAWLIGDTKTNEIARLELGLKHVGFERTRNGFFIGSNVAENLEVLRFDTDSNETDIRRSSIARRVRWKQLMSQHKGRITVESAKLFEADHYDSYLGQERPSSRTLCGHFELDRGDSAPDVPFDPSGTFDAKAVDASMARRMTFLARWGSACGRAFDAEAFLERHPQFDWMKGILKSRPTEPWTEVSAFPAR